MAQYQTGTKRLIEACIKGNRQAQFQLYEQHKIFLFGVCLRYVKNRETAEDILQEGFHKIFKFLKDYKGEGSLSAWMRRVMVNTALMHLRKKGKIQFYSIDELEELPYQFTDSALLDRDRAKAIIYMIQSLPPSYQTVFNLRAMDGYSFKEISAQLNINEATLRSHYLRARQHLQKLLQQEMNKYG